MPVVVRELVIRATLEQGKKPPEEEAKQPAAKREKLISEAVDQVVEIMNEREER